MSLKLRSEYFGNFSRAPREEADLFVTKPLFLAVYHSIGGLMVFFVNLAVSAPHIPDAVVDQQMKRFSVSLLGLLGAGVGLVLLLRKLAESSCKLQSIYGNQGAKRKARRVKRDESYRSISREESSDSLA